MQIRPFAGDDFVINLELAALTTPGGAIREEVHFKVDAQSSRPAGISEPVELREFFEVRGMWVSPVQRVGMAGKTEATNTLSPPRQAGEGDEVAKDQVSGRKGALFSLPRCWVGAAGFAAGGLRFLSRRGGTT